MQLGSKYNPNRIKHEIEKSVEITRNVYSAEKLGETIHENDVPHRNYQPKNYYTPAEPLD